MCGLTHDGNVEIIENLYCVRKYMSEKHDEWKSFLKTPQKNIFSFVSHPKMSAQQSNILKNIEAWCHPFKDRNRFLSQSVNYILLPESDFMDASFVDVSNKKITYDFFYFTVNSKQGIEYKGLHNFIKMLPTLCGKLKQRGLVVVYYPAVNVKQKLDCIKAEYKHILNKYSDQLTFLWGFQNQKSVANIMSSCKYGLFPNEVDCSPRMIPETILRNKPVLVNKDIYGGWHYINNGTGDMFDCKSEDSIEKCVNHVLNLKTDGRDFFMKNYGFNKSSKKLRNFLLNSGFNVEKYTNVYFYCFKNIMKDLCQ